jgi:hypothetical protein
MLEVSQGGMLQVEAPPEAIRSRTPAVYVPRRFRIGGIEGIRTGAAIVGTPQGDGMVAIDVESTAYVEPNPVVWTTWIEAAARRHTSGDEGEMLESEQQTRLVSEAALVEVGKCIQGRVLIDDASKGAELSRWLQAGRADYVVDGYLPGE